MVQLALVGKVGPVDGELIVGVEHTLKCEVCRPGVWARTLQDKHPVVDGGAVDGTRGVLEWWGVVGVRGRSEDDVPGPRDVVHLGSPDVSRPGLTGVLAAAVRAEDDAGLGVVPVVRQAPGAPEGDVVVGGVREEVPVVSPERVLRHPRVSHVLGEDGVVVGCVGRGVGAHLGWIPALGTGLVGVEGLSVNE